MHSDKVLRTLDTKDDILYALDEANMLELSRTYYDIDNMLGVATRLSGAPFKWVSDMYIHMKEK
ncbi:MAG: hypothetical protein COA84_13410 [Robiginitomaculum sp.]|nr:MAG: hypothetical protein COA84_13410 [Robiginitomaculum sp.]